MTEWISVKDSLPTSQGKILILIEDREFIALDIKQPDGFYWSLPDIYEYHLPSIDISGIFQKNGKWILPSHFKEPSHWMPIPEKPK